MAKLVRITTNCYELQTDRGSVIAVLWDGGTTPQTRWGAQPRGPIAPRTSDFAVGPDPRTCALMALKWVNREDELPLTVGHAKSETYVCGWAQTGKPACKRRVTRKGQWCWQHETRKPARRKAGK